MSKIKYAFILVLPFIITACQITKPKDIASIEQQWKTHQQTLEQINTFRVNGSIAQISEKTRNYGRFLITQQSVNHFEVKLTTPIGTNILTLKSEPDFAELINKNGNRYSDTNIENLMKKVSNVNIPFNSLHNWLKGYSNSINDKLDNSGRLVSTEFMQNNNKWNLKIPSYSTYTYKNQKIDLPAIIELNHDGENIRLKISNWILQ